MEKTTPRRPYKVVCILRSA